MNVSSEETVCNAFLSAQLARMCTPNHTKPSMKIDSDNIFKLKRNASTGPALPKIAFHADIRHCQRHNGING